MKKQTRENWRIIGRGVNGWHAQKQNAQSTNGSLENYTYWTGEKCNGYLAEAKEGAYIYDAETADIDAFSKFIICGPMVGFGRECLKDYRTAGSLQYVSAANYIKLLKDKVPGVKTGRVRNGAIIWD